MKHKIGETKPEIDKCKAVVLHGSNCGKPCIVSKPLARIEKITVFSKTFYSDRCWTCLNCNWESEKLRTRTV